MSWVVDFAKSSLGAKVVMALTGFLLVVFVFGHMAGNLQVFIGRDQLNHYAELLQSTKGLLWTVRVVMLASVLLHLGSGLRLATLNLRARPVGYRVKENQAAGLSGRTMALSGLMLAAFVVYHLLQFTAGVTDPTDFALYDELGRHDVYNMVVLGFQQPLVAGSYIVAMVLLGMHLSHGISSMFQSIGLTNKKYAPAINKVGPALAILVVLGNISMPAAGLAGFVNTVGM